MKFMPTKTPDSFVSGIVLSDIFSLSCGVFIKEKFMIF